MASLCLCREWLITLTNAGDGRANVYVPDCAGKVTHTSDITVQEIS